MGLLFYVSVNGQVKIGDNPQTLDPGSVLELESTDKALVITRLTTGQMEALDPLRGALVYNTDTQCIHYFDGAQWVNLCDGANIDITTDPIVNPISTIVVTTTADGNNIEVAPNSIRTEQIVDGGVNGVDIQDNSIGPNKLANNSVGQDQLAENAVGQFALDRDDVPLSFFINDVPFLTSGDVTVVSGDTGNALTIGGDTGAFFDQQPLLDAIATNTTAIGNDGDTSSNNEIQNLTLLGDQLSLSGSGVTVTLPSDDGSGTQLNAGANITINGNGTTGTPYVIAADDETDGSITNELQDLDFNVVTNILSISNSATPAGGSVDLSSLAGGGGTTEVVDGTTLSGDGTGADPFTIVPGINGQVLTTDGLGNVAWGNATVGGSTELADQLTIVGDGSLGSEFEVANEGITTAKIQPLTPAPATNQMLVTTPGGIVAWAPVPTTATITATDVTFAPYISLGSTNTQAAIQELKDEVDDIIVAGGGNPSDELQDLELTGSILTLTNPATVGNQVDLDLFFATDAEITALNFDDADPDPSNEIQAIGSIDGSVTITPVGTNDFDLSVAAGSDDQNLTSAVLTGTDLEIAIEAGNPTTADLGALATDLELAAAITASEGLDNDTSDTNEIQAITSVDNSVTITPVGTNDFDLSVAAGSDDQNLTSAVLTGTDLEIAIEAGNPTTADLGALATDLELAAAITASEGLDNDTSDTNEIQAITSVDNSVTITASGDDFDLSVAGGSTDDQNLTSAVLTGTDLEIAIEAGNPTTADLGALATDLELAAAITASEGLDNDTSDTNEIQAITSVDNSVTITASGDDFDLSVAGGSTDDQNLTSAVLTGTDLEIAIEAGNPTTADLGALATDLELAAAITASEGLDNDTSDTNEIQAITSVDNSVTITASGDDFDLSVAGGSTDDQNLTSAVLTGTDLEIAIEAGNPTTADLGALATDLELAAAITASEGLDNDTSDTNEIQAITSVDNSVTITASGDDFDLSVAGGSTDDQNLTSAVLTGTDLEIAIEAGNPTTADLGALATDLELAAAITASEGLDNDTSDTNEIQAITSVDNSVTITASGDDFDLSVAGGVTGSTGSIFFADGSGTPSENNTQLFWDIGNTRLGVGLATPAEKLHVDGNIRANLNFISGVTTLAVPDYVFETYFTGHSDLNANYRFKTLEEIEAFVKKNNHLPGVVSAKEAKQTGQWNLTKSSVVNLEKIEELYLHTIEQEKEINALKLQNETLSETVAAMKKELDEIKAMVKKEYSKRN